MNTEASSQERSTQYLSFFVGDEVYALAILEAREIIQYPAVTKMPSMPASIRGVINLRGSVVPVVDLALLFGLPERAPTKWTCVLVVVAQGAREGQTDLVGIIIDSVSQVIDLPPSAVESPPTFGTRAGRRFLSGIGNRGKGFVLLLDLARVLEQIEQERVASGAASPAGGPPSEGEAELPATELDDPDAWTASTSDGPPAP